MVVHVDQVKVDEAAPRPPGPHGDVQVLHRVRGQREHTPGVRLGTAREAGWGAVPALCRPHAGSPTPAAQAAERPPREPQRLGRWGGHTACERAGGARATHLRADPATRSGRSTSRSASPRVRPSVWPRCPENQSRPRRGRAQRAPAPTPGKESARPALSRRTAAAELIPDLLLVFAFQ